MVRFPRLAGGAGGGWWWRWRRWGPGGPSFGGPARGRVHPPRVSRLASLPPPLFVSVPLPLLRPLRVAVDGARRRFPRLSRALAALPPRPPFPACLPLLPARVPGPLPRFFARDRSEVRRPRRGASRCLLPPLPGPRGGPARPAWPPAPVRWSAAPVAARVPAGDARRARDEARVLEGCPASPACRSPGPSVGVPLTLLARRSPRGRACGRAGAVAGASRGARVVAVPRPLAPRLCRRRRRRPAPGAREPSLTLGRGRRSVPLPLLPSRRVPRASPPRALCGPGASHADPVPCPAAGASPRARFTPKASAAPPVGGGGVGGRVVGRVPSSGGGDTTGVPRAPPDPPPSPGSRPASAPPPRLPLAPAGSAGRRARSRVPLPG